MPRQRRSRIYWRIRGGERRAYGDFRDYADVGGGREALAAEGERQATTDPTTADVLLARRLEELEAKRRGRVLLGIIKHATLGEMASLHLVAKKRAGVVTDETVAENELYLTRALEYFGSERDLTSLTVSDVRQWMAHLQTQVTRRKLQDGSKGHLSAWSARHHLSALSNLYRRAASEGYVPPGFNPAAALMEKPRANQAEARWLEVHDAALLMESARTYKPKRRTFKPGRDEIVVPFAYPLIATFLLTGARSAEILGLEVEDVSFDRHTITFRPNQWRRLKTAASRRTVPMWPQLEEILRPYVFGADAPPGRLLFPSLRTGKEAMLTDFRKLLDGPPARKGKDGKPKAPRAGHAIAVRAGWQPGDVRSKMFRHTYCAARLQTLDHGAPVSIYTVSRELGHGSTAMVQKVYSHLGDVRHRSDVVEYRVEQHRAKLGEKLATLTPGVA